MQNFIVIGPQTTIIRIEPLQQLLDDCTHKRNSKRKVGKPLYD